MTKGAITNSELRTILASLSPSDIREVIADFKRQQAARK